MNAGVFAPLRYRDYRRLWTGQVVSVIGDKVNQIAMAMLVYAVTGSMLQMGIMLGVTLLPAALFGLPAGVYVDRWDRRVTMIGADLVRAAVVVLIPFVVQYGVWWAYLLAFIASTVGLFFVPAKRALIPDIVPEPSLMAANSLDSASEAIAELTGLAVGAAIVSSIGFRLAFTIDSLTFLVSALTIATIRHRQPPLPFPSEHHDLLAETVEGVRAVWRSDVLRQLSAIYVLAAVFISAAIAVCYALALERYNAGATGVALLDAASAIGILAGSILVGRGGSTRAGVKFLAGVACFGVVFGLVALADSIWVAMGLLVLGGIANMFFYIPATMLYQSLSERSVRGRVIAASATGSRIAMVLGIVTAGALADALPIQLVIVGIGATALLIAAVGWTQRALREA